MRLIDADKLGYEDIKCVDGHTYMVVHAPEVDHALAYDMDEVIRQIEAAGTDGDGVVCYVDKKPVITKELAIKIIKSGGIG